MLFLIIKTGKGIKKNKYLPNVASGKKFYFTNVIAFKTLSISDFEDR